MRDWFTLLTVDLISLLAVLLGVLSLTLVVWGAGYFSTRVVLRSAGYLSLSPVQFRKDLAFSVMCGSCAVLFTLLAIDLDFIGFFGDWFIDLARGD